MAKSIECRCDAHLTCGYCLRNMKPYFWTISDGSAIAVIPDPPRILPREEEDDA